MTRWRNDHQTSSNRFASALNAKSGQQILNLVTFQKRDCFHNFFIIILFIIFIYFKGLSMILEWNHYNGYLRGRRFCPSCVRIKMFFSRGKWNFWENVRLGMFRTILSLNKTVAAEKRNHAQNKFDGEISYRGKKSRGKVTTFLASDSIFPRPHFPQFSFPDKVYGHVYRVA